MTEESILPAASGEFTHSLFDTAGSLGWHPHTPATASDAPESDATDADDSIEEGDDMPRPASDPI